MIRCENCGHTLKDDQKICDVCGKPVRRKKTEDVELEEQLAKPIAKIVENETVDAQVYLKEIQGTLDKNKQGQNRVTDNDVLGVSQRSSVLLNLVNCLVKPKLNFIAYVSLKVLILLKRS